MLLLPEGNFSTKKRVKEFREIFYAIIGRTQEKVHLLNNAIAENANLAVVYSIQIEDQGITQLIPSHSSISRRLDNSIHNRHF